MLASIAILAILSTLTFVTYKRFLHTGDGSICIANMKSLYGSFASYTTDNNRWPQQPDFDMQTKTGRNNYAKWWIETMKPYTVSEKVWQCPTLARMEISGGYPPEYLMHYTPTIFDAFPTRPYQWSFMPWLVEIGAAHGDGANVLFPDGSIRGFNSIADSWK